MVSEAQVCSMAEKNIKKRNYKCVICGVDIYVKPHRILKENFGFTCSRDCACKIRSIKTKGSGNHQYGLKGKMNASFKSGTRISNYGYVLIYLPEHKRANCNGYVFEHIIKMEEHLGRELKFVSKLNKDNEVVHHIDFNKKNNNIENLMLLTRGEHTSLHNRINPMPRDLKGRIMKLSETERGVNGFGSTDKERV